jgi:hypothetical protein
MKKIIVKLLLVLSIFMTVSPLVNADDTLWSNWSNKCGWYNFDEDISVWVALNKCLSNADLINWENVSLGWKWWFWKQIKRWTQNISLYLWLFSVASIVIWALMLTFSAWEEEKIKKWKDVVKWGIIWFFGIVVASSIITLIIKLVYSL